MRKIYFIKNKLQFRYLSLIIASLILPTILVGGCLYYLIFSFMAEKLGIPESIESNLAPVVNKVNFVVAVGFPIIFLILLGWGVALSHKLAGPIKRLERELDEIVEGKHHKNKIHLRRGDDLKPIADKMNKILEKIHK